MESWKEKRNRLVGLIKELSDLHGGDDKKWLEEYCQEVVMAYKNDLDTALTCFDDLVKQKKKIIIV